MGAAVAIGAIVSGASQAKQYRESKKAASAAKRQAEIERQAELTKARYSNVQAQKARIQQVREARIRRAQVTAATGGEGLGFAGTSSFQGSIGSITSQENANITATNADQTLGNSISAFNIASGEAQSDILEAGARAQQWQTIGNIGTSIFNAGGGFTTIFDGNTNKKAGS